MSGVSCCPRCRLLQRDDASTGQDERCSHCGDDTPLVRLADDWRLLLQARVEGVGAARKLPAQGWRDGVALMTTAVGVIGGAIAVAVWTASPFGLLAGPAVGALGYSKQFWRTVLKRRRRLRPVAAPVPPLGAEPEDAHLGVAQAWQRTVAAVGDAEGRAALVATLTLSSRGGLLLRQVRAAPFWLVADGGDKTLVAGACWLQVVQPTVTSDAETVRALLDALGVPEGFPLPGKLIAQQAQIEPGERVLVFGAVRTEQVVGLGGYRDATVPVIRGEPGRPVWIARVE